MKTLIDWDVIHAELETEKQAMQATIARIEQYVATLPYTSLVYTKLEEEISKGRFMIAIERGRFSFDHKYISLTEVN